jgi:predicted SnoaL-like aldol condensation-catalyzing enzyme
MDAGQAGGIRVEKAAKKIVEAIRRQKPETLIGGKEQLMVYFKRFIPTLNRKMARSIKAE